MIVNTCSDRDGGRADETQRMDKTVLSRWKYSTTGPTCRVSNDRGNFANPHLDHYQHRRLILLATSYQQVKNTHTQKHILLHLLFYVITTYIILIKGSSIRFLLQAADEFTPLYTSFGCIKFYLFNCFFWNSFIYYQ